MQGRYIVNGTWLRRHPAYTYFYILVKVEQGNLGHSDEFLDWELPRHESPSLSGLNVL